MTTVYDVPADHLIRKVALELKSKKEITPPVWAAFAKTGVHKEMPPEDPDWWFVRAAAVLRRVYVDGPLGVERMRSFYGGKKNRGSKPNAFRKGSGSILRKALQQLEAAGLIVHDTKVGRKVSPAGMAFLDSVAKDVLANPPAPVPKRVKPVVEEPKKADHKKPEGKKGKAEKPDEAKGEKKPAAKKAEGKKPEKSEKSEAPKAEGKKPEAK